MPMAAARGSIPRMPDTLPRTSCGSKLSRAAAPLQWTPAEVGFLLSFRTPAHFRQLKPVRPRRVLFCPGFRRQGYCFLAVCSTTPWRNYRPTVDSSPVTGSVVTGVCNSRVDLTTLRPLTPTSPPPPPPLPLPPSLSPPLPLQPFRLRPFWWLWKDQNFMIELS